MDISVNAVTYLQLEVEDNSISNQSARFLGAHVAYLLIYWSDWAEVITDDETL